MNTETEETKRFEDMTAPQAVRAVLEDGGGAMQPKDLVEATGKEKSAIKSAVRRMEEKGKLKKLDRGHGLYTLPDDSEDESVKEKTETHAPMSSNGHMELPFLSKGDLSEVKADLSEVAKGEEPLPNEADEYLTVDSKLVKTINDDRRQAVVQVPGNSMSKTVSGDSRIVVEIDKKPRITQGGMYVWVSDHGCVVITRVHLPGGSTVRLVPDNDDYPVIELEGDRDEWAWTCIARVTQVLSGV
jgi:phage repressor protein C with HTH and peptisase S24 domain